MIQLKIEAKKWRIERSDPQNEQRLGCLVSRSYGLYNMRDMKKDVIVYLNVGGEATANREDCNE